MSGLFLSEFFFFIVLCFLIFSLIDLISYILEIILFISLFIEGNCLKEHMKIDIIWKRIIANIKLIFFY